MAATGSRSELAGTDVVVIGGGLAGLTAAMGLGSSGLRITLCEASALLGGRARSWTDERTGHTVDIGPHILLRGLYPNFERLLAELGTEDQIVWEPQTFIHLVEGYLLNPQIYGHL